MIFRTAIFIAVALIVSLAWATTPSTISFQGRLTDTAGNPIPDGAYSVTFAIYPIPTGDDQIWVETKSISVTDGLFATNLGSAVALTNIVFTGPTRYLGIQVGADPEIQPRTLLSSVPYSHRVSTVDGASGGFITSDLTVVGKLTMADTTNLLSTLQCNVFSPSSPLAMQISSNGNSGEVVGIQSAASNSGSSAGTFGGKFSAVESSGSGEHTGLRTFASSNNGYARGLLAISSVNGSGSSIGCLGDATNNGSGLTQAGNFAAYGQGSGVAMGLSAHAFSVPTNSSTVIGIDAAGVANGSGTSYGGYFEGGNTGGTGSHYGIYATAIGAGTNYAGYFSGNVSITGTLTKGAGAFRIDHPLDPENKYLQHSFVESPEMKNIYDGIVTTDARGFATVTLPAWFEPLNTEFRNQLTTIGDFAQAIVAEEIKGNRFVIQTAKPLVKVSWQVTGIRQDAFANANRIQVEVDKRAEERGLYAHPEASGISSELGVERVLHPRSAAVENRIGDRR